MTDAPTERDGEGCAPQILDPGRTDRVAGPSPSCGVIASAQIVLRSLADLAGLVVPSATPLARRRIGERLGVRAGSALGGLHHEHPPAPAWARSCNCGAQGFRCQGVVLLNEAIESNSRRRRDLAISPDCSSRNLRSHYAHTRRIAGSPPRRDHEGHRWSPDHINGSKTGGMPCLKKLPPGSS